MIAFDHLVVAGPDLEELVRLVSTTTGVRSVPGGPHVGLGTTNELIGVGPTSYVELIGPDRGQPDPNGPRPFGIDQLSEPRLVTWALAVSDMDVALGSVRKMGINLGQPSPMSRLRPDGVMLSWRLTIPPPEDFAGVMPFLICWDEGTPHPASSLPADLTVSELLLSHPQPEPIQSAIGVLTGSRLEVAGGEPGLSVILGGPGGQIEF